MKKCIALGHPCCPPWYVNSIAQLTGNTREDGAVEFNNVSGGWTGWLKGTQFQIDEKHKQGSGWYNCLIIWEGDEWPAYKSGEREGYNTIIDIVETSLGKPEGAMK